MNTSAGKVVLPHAVAARPAAQKPAVRPAAPIAKKVLGKKSGPAVQKPLGSASPKAAKPMPALKQGAAPMPGAKILTMPKPANAKRSGIQVPALLKPVAVFFAMIGHALSGLFSHLHIPKPSRGAVLIAVGSLAAVALAAVVVVNSGLFAVTDIQVKGTEHVEQATAEALVEIPEGASLLNVDTQPILDALSSSPWVKDVTIERVWPHGLVVTPVERKVRAIAYVSADEVAWAVGDDGAWIAPVSLSVAVDANGNEVELGEDGSVPEGATQLSAYDAALRVAKDAGCMLLTDVPSDASPKSGEPVSSKVVLAGLDYVNGFSASFAGQIKSLSVASVEAISANLTSGIEVSLGAPEHIAEKERVVTKLLEQEAGVTYVNVREPGAYTFRSAPQ
ncbi:MAG: FtsQ-type POTRA domain-containing protein [Coriobacteriaceae bacterium]|nr:FtsQ-type POTRA domain-containing protein [Coriobacteriaceae bacterium]